MASKHKNVSRVVLDLGDGRMAAPGDVVEVDPKAVAGHVDAGRLKAVSTPKRTSATSEEKV